MERSLSCQASAGAGLSRHTKLLTSLGPKCTAVFKHPVHKYLLSSCYYQRVSWEVPQRASSNASPSRPSPSLCSRHEDWLEKWKPSSLFDAACCWHHLPGFPWVQYQVATQQRWMEHMLVFRVSTDRNCPTEPVHCSRYQLCVQGRHIVKNNILLNSHDSWCNGQ